MTEDDEGVETEGDRELHPSPLVELKSDLGDDDVELIGVVSTTG